MDFLAAERTQQLHGHREPARVAGKYSSSSFYDPGAEVGEGEPKRYFHLLT